MGGIAILARQAGYAVGGADGRFAAPMLTQLKKHAIDYDEGWDPAQIPAQHDQIIIGNVVSRGNPMVEHILSASLPFTSGPQWIAENILYDKWVIAVSGTHGKTTTSSMIVHILEENGLNPSFLIGGVSANFGVSARYTSSQYFVIEADEYDTAFFDKRAKFIHYHPRTLVINNLEYDHADIYPDMEAIERQFHYLLRTVPGNGCIIALADPAIDALLAKGCWSPVQRMSMTSDADWYADLLRPDGTHFAIRDGGKVRWEIHGRHNVYNALAAVAAAAHVGISPQQSIAALSSFCGVKRRQEKLAVIGGVVIYDDFAHHPTAIRNTLASFKVRYPNERVIAVIEPRSNSMKQGAHFTELREATRDADYVFWYQPEGVAWSFAEVQPVVPFSEYNNIADMLDGVLAYCRAGDQVVIMSNGDFSGFPYQLITRLNAHKTDK